MNISRLRICVVNTLLLLAFFAPPLQAASYKATGDIIGSLRSYTIKKGDTYRDIARKFDIGIVELLTANPGVNPQKPEAGKVLTLTTTHILPGVPHEGIVLNLSELRLFYFAGNDRVLTFPVSIGREGWETPLGLTKVVRKRKDPTWTPPDSIREENPDLPEVVPAGKDNPLGAYALSLGWAGYVIHGTNRPYSVGKRASHGCIRLYPEDIKTLFNEVEVGTPVTVVDMPYKLGWLGDVLYLEVTPTQVQSDAIARYQPPVAVDGDEIRQAILRTDAEVNWNNVEQAVAARSGIPIAIGKRRSSQE